ncbi:serine/threonine-protein phosphatase pp1 isozyme 2 [Anaeramoeba flamelloides]|uniref:Serine/threonine-protein phosphatase n=1 Tax=Anaeramoeba flamelloides TaxID=1746091 RepID=A0ABQ8XZM8_9EUKA|nr:serine/threonine-protein phosphatase pp1 isozyme 2 [Anaeramoeba flamelloides]
MQLEIKIDSILERLIQASDPNISVSPKIPENEIRALIERSRTIFMDQEALLELKAPINICGDIHGQFCDLIELFKMGGFPPLANYLFLGDFVDRGDRSLETICMLLCYKVLYPANFFMLRGNHETQLINQNYGFYAECISRYSPLVYKAFSDCFNVLPLAAIIDDRIFCVHGGLSPELDSIERIKQITRPTEVGTVGLLCDLLWSDPSEEVERFGQNERRVSVTFGEIIVEEFLQKNNFDLVVRAHQVVTNGYEFFAGKQLITIFSAPEYCGEFDNYGAMMIANEELEYVLYPLQLGPFDWKIV